MRYSGHQGSVNSLEFHPCQELVITASGDMTAHVWSASPAHITRTQYSDTESGDSSDDGITTNTDAGAGGSQSQALVVLSGHAGVVVSADWLSGGDQCVTASWDRTAALWDVSSQTMIQALTGHDMELTGAACHPTSWLVVSSSKDSTFRLWDFRETIHSVSVFQGHTESVTSAAFSSSDRIVSGSDDRSVKVWDLRNMRAPVTNIQCASAVNRIAVSQAGTIAVPHDNRQVTLHDLSGQKLLRLPRDGAKCHHRMVTSTCWSGAESSENWRSRANLFSAGFDRVAFGWSVRSSTRDKDEGFKVK